MFPITVHPPSRDPITWPDTDAVLTWVSNQLAAESVTPDQVSYLEVLARRVSELETSASGDGEANLAAWLERINDGRYVPI